MNKLTLRSALIGIFGSAIVSMSSIYVALRIGALPWPTIFAAILSMSILKSLKNTSLREINITHTAISAGGLVAGGIAFTIPALIIIEGKFNLSLWKFSISSIVGALLGISLISLIRKRFVEDESFPFPIGVATVELLKAGDEGGRKAKIMFSYFGISSIFTFLRDWFGFIPAVYKGIGLFPMAGGIGFIIGSYYTVSWFVGGLVGNFVIPHFGSTDFSKNLGIGIMIGSGIALIIRNIKFKGGSSGPNLKRFFLPFIISIVGFPLCGFNILLSLILIPLMWFIVNMAASVDGQTGIDPMEVFGIIILVILIPLLKLDTTTSVLVASIVAIATGITGDGLQDMKAGYILGTNPRAQILSEMIGSIVGVVFSIVSFMVLLNVYGKMGPGTNFPAPQAYAVSKIIQGVPDPTPILLGLTIGFILQFMKLPALTFGVGVYLPMSITFPVAIGGGIRIIFDLFLKDKIEDGVVTSAGLLGGEGFAGVVISMIRFFMKM
ncbi:MAG: OPT/YSL family transporter [Thermotogae bacterium]|nr:OPT/YSL family transporter [Thermotogota bacterium]